MLEAVKIAKHAKDHKMLGNSDPMLLFVASTRKGSETIFSVFFLLLRPMICINFLHDECLLPNFGHAINCYCLMEKINGRRSFLYFEKGFVKQRP